MAIQRYAVGREGTSEHKITGHVGKLRGGVGVNIEGDAFLHKKEWDQFVADVNELMKEEEAK